MSILDAFYSLGRKVNKAIGNQDDVETQEGLVSDAFPELKLEMANDDIVKLTTAWEKKWVESEVYSVWKEAADENERYWRGEHFDQPKKSKNRQLVDNLIFESLETYLPQVTRRNPDPMVSLSKTEEPTEENTQFALNIQKELGEIADEISLRLKLKKAARFWAIFLLGVKKYSWDSKKNIPTSKVIRPHKLILDPDATIDEDGYSGEFIGEHRKMKAGNLIDTLKEVGGEAESETLIMDSIKDGDKDNLGTDIGFIEWWTNEYVCWTLGKKVLLKKKNPHWNYDSETQEEAPYNEDGTPQIDPETGAPMMIKNNVPGINHLDEPSMPYSFLSVFNLGKQPVDETSLVGQNLPGQDLVNKRIAQIDKNADSMNNGMVVSLERSGLTVPQASKAAEALRNGGVVAIPAGAVNEAMARMSANPLPADIYAQLNDTRTRMRDIFGTRGSSAAGLSTEETVRGKMQNRNLDTDRIGGGFSEYLEQMADEAYNWYVQLLYVYDERYIGQPKPKIRVSVKEGSLLPKDSFALANQAIELAGQNRMSLIDLYKALDYPNPEELAANVWLEANSPEMLYGNDPRVQQVLAQRQQAAAASNDKPVSKSISFKDLPPEGQAQLAKQAGLNLNPEAIAVYNEAQKAKENEQKINQEVKNTENRDGE
jgi:hypothetical protein